jgi:hypothetical protein
LNKIFFFFILTFIECKGGRNTGKSLQFKSKSSFDGLDGWLYRHQVYDSIGMIVIFMIIK